MTRQTLVLVVAATALCGCASMDVPASGPSLQNAVYIPGGDGAALKQANVDNSTMMPGESKAMKFYWFLGGR